jgi:hypothetical protein
VNARPLLAAAAFAVALWIGAASAGGSAPPQAPKAFPAQLDRVAFARVYQDGQWTAQGETPTTIGKALATLKPTWVATLLRFKKNDPVTPKVVKAHNTITQLVEAANPQAEFGVELNAMQYRKPSQVVRMMNAVRAKIDVDGWTMDFYTPAYRKYPQAVEAAIAAAHANGEWIGGNAFRLSNTPRVPPGSDFIAVQDFGFQLDLQAVKELAQAAPVVYHLNNTPEDPDSDGCKFIESFTTARRAALLRQRASQQAANDFRVGYPVLFPECERGINTNNPQLYTYNAMRDGSMMQTISGLMDQYPLASP